MKTTNKFIAVSAMVMATGILLAGCQREESGNLEDGKLVIGLQMEDLSTKVDVDGTTGACTWTSGDQIGICVTDSNGSAYSPVSVNTTSNTVHLTLTPEMSIIPGYSITPYYMADGSDAEKTGTTPRVYYKTSYSMSGKTLTSETFSWVPMMAVTNDEFLRFYHTGALLRLVMANVPDGTVKITVTFQGMTNVCGKCTVTKPGTSQATTAIAVGEGNVVTFTDVTRSASTMYLNVPLPTIDYSDLTAIRVECLGSTNNSLGIVSKSILGSWTTLKHGYGRRLDVDFGADLLSGVRLSSDAAVTLWKSKTVQRTATALDQYGLPYADATVVWSSNNTPIATVDANTGVVTARRPGNATITATATPNVGGTAKENSFTVYVNAVTGISISGPGSVLATKSKFLTATIEHTNNGNLLSYPSDMSIGWLSSGSSYVSVSPSNSYVDKIDPTHASTTVVASGLAEGESNITANVSSDFSFNGSALSDTLRMLCDLETTITITEGGEPYKFRGIYMSPGILVYDGNSNVGSYGYSLTDGSDPLEILQHYYYDNNGGVGLNVYFHAWAGTNSLYHRIHNDPSYPKAVDITNNIRIDESVDWRIPSGGSSSYYDTYKIMNVTPSITIKINNKNNSSYYSNAIYVVVDLIDATNVGGYDYHDKGLVNATVDESGKITSLTYVANGTAGSYRYQTGVLLIPDGAEVTCSRIKNIPGNFTNQNSKSNLITWDDLKILTEGGCVFLPAAGYYQGYNSLWYLGGQHGYYFSSNQSGSNGYYAKPLRFESGTWSSEYFDKSNYTPIHLVR